MNFVGVSPVRAPLDVADQNVTHTVAPRQSTVRFVGITYLAHLLLIQLGVAILFALAVTGSGSASGNSILCVRLWSPLKEMPRVDARRGIAGMQDVEAARYRSIVDRESDPMSQSREASTSSAQIDQAVSFFILSPSPQDATARRFFGVLQKASSDAVRIIKILNSKTDGCLHAQSFYHDVSCLETLNRKLIGAYLTANSLPDVKAGMLLRYSPNSVR